MAHHGLFVGLVTLDLIYQTPAVPQPNQKIVALDYMMAAGGPATNAAVAFSYLGGQPTLMGVIGAHPLGQLAVAELQAWGIHVADLMPDHPEPLPTSSILVTATTGDRAVISLNATRSQASTNAFSPDLLDDVSVVLIDGHQMAVGRIVAQQATDRNLPVVIDGGSWKPGFEEVLPYARYVICSEAFRPPNCETFGETFAYLESLGVTYIAMTRGSEPIVYVQNGILNELPIPQIVAVDTLGAGDVFHGAFCRFILENRFEAALTQAAGIAAKACQSFGTRQWMQT